MMFPRKSLLSILFAVLATAGALAIAPHAFAQVVDPTLTNGGLESFAAQAGFSTGQGLTVTIARLIRTVLSTLGILAVIFILIGGFRYMTSGGADDKVKSAKKVMTNAIIGLVIILSAFAIVQFILGQLVGALNGTNTSSGGSGNGGGYGDGGGTSSQFVLTSVNTDCAYAIKNLQLQFLFSQNATVESVNDGGIRVRKAGVDVPGTFQPTDGSASSSSRAISFVPTADCGSDYPAFEHCFDAGADYTIELSESILKDSSDRSYRCDTEFPCTFSFTTGTAVDTEGPTTMELTAPEEGAAVYTNEIRPLQAYTVDDTGVSSLAFTIDNGDSIYDAALSTDSSAGSLSPENYFSTADGTEWYVSSDYATGRHTVRARGYDCAGHANTSSDVTVEVYPASCNDGITNNGEAEPGDCGGTSECGACDGSSCTSNADCSSGYCSGEINPSTGLVINGVCTSVPEITSVSPGDGAADNLISVIGSGFGSSAGTVTFLGGDGSADDVVVSGYQCASGANPWSDTQIIVQLTDAIADGPVQVTTAADASGNVYADATDDEYGATVNDFDLNSVVRPGLCPPSPTSGVGHATVELSGNNFFSAGSSGQGTSTVYFENYEASEYFSWAATALSVQVPLLNARSYDTQVWVGDYVCATAQGIALPEVCSTDADCTASSGETCETRRCSGSDAFCDTNEDCGTDGSCVSLRQGSNKVSFEVVDASVSSNPVIAAVVSGWMGCGGDATLCAAVDGFSEECDGRGAGDSCDAHDDWGPPGQYVTITGTGFGTATGNVILTDSTGIAYGDFAFPESCGDDTWEDTEITFKVPASYDETEGIGAAVSTGAYALTVRTVPGATSEGVEFTILGGTPGPGICNIDPSAGPASTSLVTVGGVDISGDNLGSTKRDSADVTFATDVSAQTLSWSDASVTTDTVPVGSATGPVYVTDSSGYRSNSMNFQVGSCAEGTISCGTGEECCGDGTCSESCPVEPVNSHYSWMFSTGDIPSTPRVRIFCAEGEGTSPAPWNFRSASEDICVNAAVTATFDQPMDWTDFASNVVVTTEDGTVVAGALSVTSEYLFEWNPTENGGEFLPSTTYSVTLLSAGIHTDALPTAYMANDYSWSFTTSASDEPCKIGSVSAMPSEFTAVEENETVDYSGQALSENDICVALNCTAYGWTWTSSEESLASIDPESSASGTCATVATALAETVGGSPVDITATAENPDGIDPDDAGQLTINFTDPEVSSFTPSCDTACLNAAIGVTFNTPMSADFDGDTVQVYVCQDSLCADNELTAWAYASDYSVGVLSDDLMTITISHSARLFEPNAWYRIVLSGSVASVSGVRLSESGSNYPSEDNGYYSGDFSWKFKTKDSAEACKVDRVATSPAAASATVIGEEHLWQAVPYGAPDDCDVDGQQLDASGYAWDAWTATDANEAGSATNDDVASMVTPLALTTSLTSDCSSNCLNSGVTLGKYDPVCGDGAITHTTTDTVPQTGGEECDGGSACSSSCLSVGNPTACSSTVTTNCCGNDIAEAGEECDDGDSSNANGCSSVCLNNGSAKAVTTCGDGRVDQSTNTGGEDCDDGNSVSGDGCSSVCLDEGGATVSGTYSTCGNGSKQTGEDCDDNNVTDGDGCSSVCLYEGASICRYECEDGIDAGQNCSGPNAATCDMIDDNDAEGVCGQIVAPCVGDGVVTYSATDYPHATTIRSEDCDDQNAIDGDGCSSSGLNEGSSLGYSTPSYCGDGSVSHTGSNGSAGSTGGEECDAADGATYGDYWGVSRINSTAASDVVNGTAESAVEATEHESQAKGDGALTLICSCETDAQCGDSSAYGCGTSSCCFERPVVVDQMPELNDTGVCRNTAVYVDFSDVMDANSLSSWADADGDGAFDYGEGHQNLYLQLLTWNGTSVVDAATCPTTYTGAQLAFDGTAGHSWIAGAWDWIVRSVRHLFGGVANADTITSFACLTPVSYDLTTQAQSDGSVGSRVSLSMVDALEASSTYRLVVVEDADPTNAADTISGVLSANAISIDASGTGSLSGAGLEGDASVSVTTFTTGTEICTLDAVTVEDLGTVESLVPGSVADPSIGYFTSKDEVHSVQASAFTVREGQEQPIQDTPSYGWDWGWGTTILDSSATNTVSASTLTCEGGDDDGDACAVAADCASGVCSAQTTGLVTAAGLTGVESVVSTASFNATNTFGDTEGGVSGTLQFASNICDNPAVNGTYVDSEGSTPSNFSFYFCRDAGVAGDLSDDLPDLEPKIDATSYSGSGILQELIFKVSDTSDAIGVRVLPNRIGGFCSVSTTIDCSFDGACPTGETCDLSTYMTPSAWYSAQGFTGAPSSTKVDGYEAVADGNTTYVAATNVSGGIIYPNIYALSYTKGAESTSQDIFNQILANWSFNANTDAVTDINLCQASDNSYPTDGTSGQFVSCAWDGDCRNTCESATASTAACSLTGTACVTDADCAALTCDAEKAKLTRDLRRLEDVTVIANAFDAYGAANGFCSVTTNQSCTSDSACPGTETCESSVPKLADGTFVSSFSVSTWPSWASGLGNAIGTSLPTDPLNQFMNCDGADYSGYEASTCWNSVTATFACPDESHVYGYQSVGGTSFKLDTQLEYDASIWAYALVPSSLGTVTAEYDHSTSGSPSFPANFTTTATFCQGSPIGTSAICGDGVIGSTTETCEIGDTTPVYCTTSADTSYPTDTADGTMFVPCSGACDGYLSESDAELAGAVCTPYSCGNGVMEADEECDDGTQNGTYGHCGDGCLLSSAFSCGDGDLAGGEQCDCGTTSNFSTVMADTGSWASLNGCATSNGQYPTDGSPTGTCAYDCTTPGPSCGDAEINGNEECDGDYASYSGNLCDDGTECSIDTDCSTGTCGSSTGTAACGTGTVCETDGNADALTDIDTGVPCSSSTGLKLDGTRCDALVAGDGVGACGTVTYDLTRSKTCRTETDTSGNMCTWNDWTACVSADYCGNGTQDGSEECDDGNLDDTDACTNVCTENVCGDGFVYSGVESCDDGSANGGSCDSSYESTCHYCTASCQYKTRSGAYCGDGQINGTEFCDGADMPYYCFDTSEVEGVMVGKGATCDPLNVGTETGCNAGSTCHDIGICNGGSENGEYCTLDASTTDTNACSGGTCVAPVCAADCGTSCPFNYESVSVLATTEAAGATGSDSIDLSTYDPTSTDTAYIDNASLSLPACTVGTQITADVNTSNVVPPSVDIVFVTDYTNTMANAVDGGTPAAGESRIELVAAATLDAVSTIFSTLEDAGSTVRASAVSFYERETDESSSAVVEPQYFVDAAMTSDQSVVETAIGLYTPGGVHYGTPHYKGLEGALAQLAGSVADKKIVVFLSDGVPTVASDGDPCGWGDGTAPSHGSPESSAAYYCIKEAATELVPTNTADTLDDDIKIFTAAITSTTSAKGYMAHLSSDACGTNYSTFTSAECSPADGVEYAYQASTQDEIATMYEDITAAILGVSVGLTTADATVTTGTVTSGHNRELPFPSNFECTGEDMDIPMTVSFNGSGYISMDNISFTYCPVQ